MRNEGGSSDGHHSQVQQNGYNQSPFAHNHFYGHSSSSSSSNSSPSGSASSSSAGSTHAGHINPFSFGQGYAVAAAMSQPPLASKGKGQVVCIEMCFFCFDVLCAHLYSAEPPKAPNFPNES